MFAIGVLWLPLLILWRVSVLGPMPEVSIELSLIYILGIVVFSPVTETLLLVLIHRLIRRRLGLTGFVFVTAALAAAAHAPLKSLPPIDAAVSFAIMAYQYVSFREQLGFGRAFWGVALAHGTNNGISAMLLLLIDFLA